MRRLGVLRPLSMGSPPANDVRLSHEVGGGAGTSTWPGCADMAFAVENFFTARMIPFPLGEISI